MILRYTVHGWIKGNYGNIFKTSRCFNAVTLIMFFRGKFSTNLGRLIMKIVTSKLSSTIENILLSGRKEKPQNTRHFSYRIKSWLPQ